MSIFESVKEKSLVELIETYYLADGTTKAHKKTFSSKKALVQLLKKSPLSTKTIYNLAKANEAYVMRDGLKVKLEIKDVHE